MKNFKRNNMLFSLCGLNCALCTMNLGGHCGGCGSEICHGCKIARCSMEHGMIEYCTECDEFPCDKYAGITEYDSFIVHRNQISDLEKFKEIGEECYNSEQTEKRKILDILLRDYNDGRKKSFYCTAVNLLGLAELKNIIEYAGSNKETKNLPDREKIKDLVEYIKEIADSKGIVLKLNRKK